MVHYKEALSLFIFSPDINISLPNQRWHLTQNGVFSKHFNKDIENVLHLSNFCQRIVSGDFQNVLNNYYHQNCSDCPGSMISSSLSNGFPYTFWDNFMTFFLDKI